MSEFFMFFLIFVRRCMSSTKSFSWSYGCVRVWYGMIWEVWSLWWIYRSTFPRRKSERTIEDSGPLLSGVQRNGCRISSVETSFSCAGIYSQDRMSSGHGNEMCGTARGWSWFHCRTSVPCACDDACPTLLSHVISTQSQNIYKIRRIYKKNLLNLQYP